MQRVLWLHIQKKKNEKRKGLDYYSKGMNVHLFNMPQMIHFLGEQAK